MRCIDNIFYAEFSLGNEGDGVQLLTIHNLEPMSLFCPPDHQSPLV